MDLLEENYVVGGMISVIYLPIENYPYLVYYEDLALPTTPNGGMLIGDVVNRYLAACNIATLAHRYSIRINKIRVVHMQPSSVNEVTFQGQTFSMSYWPPTTLEFAFLPHNYNNIQSIVNATNYTNFKHFDIKPFNWGSDPGEYVWEFDEKTGVPGYGTFTEIRPQNTTLSHLPGMLYARGYYTSFNGALWDYRRCNIYISVTLRDIVLL